MEIAWLVAYFKASRRFHSDSGMNAFGYGLFMVLITYAYQFNGSGEETQVLSSSLNWAKDVVCMGAISAESQIGRSMGEGQPRGFRRTISENVFISFYPKRELITMFCLMSPKANCWSIIVSSMQHSIEVQRCSLNTLLTSVIA